MKELLGRFRFGDFSAYFLPGLVLLAALVTPLPILGVTKFTSVFHSAGLVETAAIACAAYVLGAIISGSSYQLIGPVFLATRRRRYSDPRQSVQPPELEDAVKAALAAILGIQLSKSWSEDHFYLARTAVHEKLPQTSAEAMRQNDIMRLRENMLIPLLAWCCVGLLFSGFLLSEHVWLGIGAVLGTLLIGYGVAGRIACRSVDNRQREVREICVGLLVGYRLGVFTAPTQSASQAEFNAPRPLALAPDAARISVSGDVAGSS